MLNLQLVQQNCPFRFMWSSDALKGRVCEVVEGLMAGFTAVTLLFHLSSTCFDNVFTKSHNKMAVAMWPDKTSFMLLYLDFINCTNRSNIGFGRDCKKYTSCCLPLSFNSSASFFISFNSTLYHLRTIIISFIMPINPFVCLTED